jgi:hypothetical protein
MTREILSSASHSAAPNCATNQARKVSDGIPAAGPVSTLGERRVSIRAYVTHGPSNPAGLRSRQRMLRMPLRSSEKVSTSPAMPAPITTTSLTGSPLAWVAGTTQFAGG